MQTWNDATMAIDRASIATGDAMSHRADAAKLLDVEVDQLTRMLALIAADRLGLLPRGEPIQPPPPPDAARAVRRQPHPRGELLACVALPAQRLDRGTRKLLS